MTAYADCEPLLNDSQLVPIEARIRSAYPLPDDAEFATAVVEWPDHPSEAHFILLVPHPNAYARGVRLRYVGSTALGAYREWEAQASRFVHGSVQDPAVIAFSEAARAACEALDTLRNTVT